jgi:hypothetical protein
VALYTVAFLRNVLGTVQYNTVRVGTHVYDVQYKIYFNMLVYIKVIYSTVHDIT